MIPFLIASVFLSAGAGGSYFAVSTTCEGVDPCLAPGAEIRALGTFGKHGPAALCFAADFAFFAASYDSMKVLAMPASVQAGYLLDLPLLKPYLLAGIGAPNYRVERGDSTYTGWGFQGGVNLGTYLMFSSFGLDLSLGADYMTIPASDSAAMFLDGSLNGPVFRGNLGLAFSW